MDPHPRRPGSPLQRQPPLTPPRLIPRPPSLPPRRPSAPLLLPPPPPQVRMHRPRTAPAAGLALRLPRPPLPPPRRPPALWPPALAPRGRCADVGVCAGVIIKRVAVLRCAPLHWLHPTVPFTILALLPPANAPIATCTLPPACQRPFISPPANLASPCCHAICVQLPPLYLCNMYPWMNRYVNPDAHQPETHMTIIDTQYY